MKKTFLDLPLNKAVVVFFILILFLFFYLPVYYE